jgi:hypothetical protein
MLSLMSILLLGTDGVVLVGECDCQVYTLSVISGVPQGTVLGPLMFLLYVNEIADKISPHQVSAERWSVSYQAFLIVTQLYLVTGSHKSDFF